jgi:hypothetical protein
LEAYHERMKFQERLVKGERESGVRDKRKGEIPTKF